MTKEEKKKLAQIEIEKFRKRLNIQKEINDPGTNYHKHYSSNNKKYKI